jgi:hypothetical protein
MLLLRLLSLLGLLLFLVLALALVSVFRNKNMYHQLNMCGVIVVVGGGVVVVVAVVVFVVVGVVSLNAQTRPLQLNSLRGLPCTAFRPMRNRRSFRDRPGGASDKLGFLAKDPSGLEVGVLPRQAIAASTSCSVMCPSGCITIKNIKKQKKSTKHTNLTSWFYLFSVFSCFFS